MSQSEYHFFWNSSLSPERQKEVQDWLNTLTPNQFQMIEELIQDKLCEESFDNSSGEDQ